MQLQEIPFVVALAASILLLLQVRPRLFPVIAVVGSGAEVLRTFGLLSFKVPVIGGALLFGAAMVVGGVGCWLKSTARVAVTAATVVALIGLMRVLSRYL
jgi:uncharacterized membrane protein YjjB (DUF3815 family)